MLDIILKLVTKHETHQALLAGLMEAEAERCQFLAAFGPARLGSLSDRALVDAWGLVLVDADLQRARAEVSGACRYLASLPPGALTMTPEQFQAVLTAVAPTFIAAPWLHRYLHRCFPERVTGSSTAEDLGAHLRLLGEDAGGDGLYACDARIIRFWHALSALRDLPLRLRYRLGEAPLRERFLGALTEEETAAEPRPAYGKPKGKRDLSSPAGAERIAGRLQTNIDRFFSAPTAPVGTDEASLRSTWEAHLELMEDGLVFCVGPLPGLPGFVRELELCAGDARQRVLTANLRDQPFRVRVPLCAGPYTVTAPKFQEELGEDMERLAQLPFPLGRPTVFRVDAEGRGQRLEGTVLTPGQHYRIVVPPQSQREMHLPCPIPDTLRAELTSLGLMVTTPPLLLSFVGPPPRTYREGRSGERYPIVDRGDRLLLRVRSADGQRVDGVHAFLRGPEGLVSLPLPSAAETTIEVMDLALGRYALEVLANETEIAGALVYFAVEQNAAQAVGPAALVAMTVAGQTVPVEDDTAWDGDLSELEVAATAPPLWPVRAAWHGVQPIRLGTLHADETGCVDLGSVVEMTRVQRQRQRMGDLSLDFGELGRVVLRHTRQPEERAIREEIADLLCERRAVIDQARRPIDILRAAWLSPLFSILGYTLRDLDGEDLGGLSAGLAAALLFVPERQDRGLVLRPAAVLVMGNEDMDWKGQGVNSPRGHALRLCTRRKLRQAVLTDGRRFGRMTAPSKLLSATHLEKTLADDTGGQMETFLSLFLAEQQS